MKARSRHVKAPALPKDRGKSAYRLALKPVLASAYFGRLTRGAQAKVLAAYWDAQRTVLPNVFAEPQDYVLQKSLGVQVMHGIFNDVVELVRANDDSVTEASSFVKVIAQADLVIKQCSRADRYDHLFSSLVVVAGVHRKGHHRRFGRGSSSGAMGRAFVMVLNCSISSW